MKVRDAVLNAGTEAPFWEEVPYLLAYVLVLFGLNHFDLPLPTGRSEWITLADCRGPRDPVYLSNRLKNDPAPCSQLRSALGL